VASTKDLAEKEKEQRFPLIFTTGKYVLWNVQWNGYKTMLSKTTARETMLLVLV